MQSGFACVRCTRTEARYFGWPVGPLMEHRHAAALLSSIRCFCVHWAREGRMGWSLLLQGWAGLEAKADEELAGLRYLLMGQKYVYTIHVYICV